MPNLFDPLDLRSITLRNRIGLSPMCTYSATDGNPGNWHLMHYGARSAGGCGLIITEATAIEPRGRISRGDTGLFTDSQVVKWRWINRFIREQGAVPAVQLAHAGRKAGVHTPFTGKGPLGDNGGWQPVAPSPLPFNEGWPQPHELTADDIDRLVTAWGDATRRARAAEFEAVEIHMAHGYLLHQFLSPLANRRNDEFGGSREKRMQFPLMVARQVRLEWPDSLPLMVRISATDWHDGGWTVDDSVEFSARLGEIGVDVIDCSSGGIIPALQRSASTGTAGPLHQVPFATRIREQAGVATAAVGQITTPAEAAGIITGGQADLVLLGRALLRNPHWPLAAAVELEADTVWPLQYERGRDS